MNNSELLNLKIENDDFDSDPTIKDYFRMLLETIWEQGEEFSGKRPFGNSGWERDLYKPLVKAGAVDGRIDEYGDIETVDRDAADKLILKLICACFGEELEQVTE